MVFRVIKSLKGKTSKRLNGIIKNISALQAGQYQDSEYKIFNCSSVITKGNWRTNYQGTLSKYPIRVSLDWQRIIILTRPLAAI